MKKIAILVLATLLVVSLVLAACGPKATPTPAPPTATPKPSSYKIGLTFGLTGAAGHWGELGRDAVLMAADEINKAGGVNGVPLEVIVEDSVWQARPAVEAATKLIEVDKVPVIITAGASCVPPQRAISEPKGVVLFNSMSRLVQQEYVGNKYFFSNIITREQEAGAMVDLPDKLGLDKAVMIYSNDAWGQGTSKLVREYWEAKGHKILASESYESEQKDFRTSIIKMKALNPDVFFWLAYTWQAGALVLQQSGEVGWKPKFTIGPDMLVAPELIQQAGTNAEGLVTVSAAWDPYDMTNQKMLDFVKRYEQKYGKNPLGWGATPYDALYIVADAIKRGGYTSEGIAGALRDTKGFNGVSATNMSLDPVLGRPTKNVTYVTVKGGKYTAYISPK